MEPALLFLGFLAVLALSVGLRWVSGSLSYRGYTKTLGRFAERLEQPRLTLDTSVFKSLARTTLRGALNGRSLRLSFREDGGGNYMKVLGDEPRFALTAGSEGARCPYCHDGIDLDGEDLDACADCKTVHHRECLEEAGGCTVFGCTGRRNRRRA